MQRICNYLIFSLILLFGTSQASDVIDIVRDAAANGDIKAQYEIGKAYIQGEGIISHSTHGGRVQWNQFYNIEKDIPTGLKWITKSAHGNNSEAAYWLGMAYLNGEYVNDNSDEAIKWLKRAQAAGHKKAAEKVRWLEDSDDDY